MKLHYFVIIILIISLLYSSSLLTGKLINNSYYTKFSMISNIKLPIEQYFILDSIGLLTGIRKLVSDIAWIQLLQYYGGPPPEQSNNEHHQHNHFEHMTKIQPGKYKKLIQYCRRVTILDPLYSYVYFYGVGSLAWNLERPDEALEYLNEGLKNLEFQKNTPNSDYWELVKYQQAIYYKLGGKYKEMLAQLRMIVDGGKAPNMVKAILANLYKKFEFYEEALQIWKQLLESGDPEYVERAKYQIKILQQLIKTKNK